VLLVLAHLSPAVLASCAEATASGREEVASEEEAATTTPDTTIPRPRDEFLSAVKSVETLERARWHGALASLFLVDMPSVAVLTSALVGFGRATTPAAATLTAAALVCAGVASAVDAASALYARLTLSTLARGRDLMSVQLLLEASEEEELRRRALL
jgi:hypothetical protein